MIKRFFQNLSKSFCFYLLAVLNLIHAVEHQSYDWLLWVSLFLVFLSVVLNLISASKGGSENA